MTKNNIPEGYKESAVGIIPQEWEVKLLGDLCKNICSGNNKERNKNGKYRIYGSTGIIGYSNTYSYNYPTILIARVGANAGIINRGVGEYDVSDNTLIVCNNNIVYEYDFAYNQLTNYNLNKLVFGSGQPLVTAGQLKRIKLPIPPMEEQRTIAEILGVWDEAIEKQSRLIEKLELRKRALMQHLLTGRTRLPGFTAPWQKVKLGEIGKTYNGLTGKSKEDFEDGNAKFIPYINVFLNEKVNIDKLEVVSVDESEKQNKVQYGDIFFTVSSETPDEVGMASVLLEYIDDTYLNSFCFGYRLNDFETLNPIFASYILRGDRFRNYMMVLAQGSTRFNISKNEVMKLRIELPSFSEQKAIAEVLTMADNEIATHRKKLDALRLQKRGLMQQLLTGKTRVKI